MVAVAHFRMQSSESSLQLLPLGRWVTVAAGDAGVQEDVHEGN